MNKIIIIMLGMFMLMGVSKCPNEKYMAPLYEDCVILTEWNEIKKG